MPFPVPEPGLLIRYSYLWLDEYREGREEGVKDRPCAIVAAIIEESGQQRVLCLPVTHQPPVRPERAIEIPRSVKLRLGLDDEGSWIVVNEANEFVWPGPDLRPVPGENHTIAYGFLPPSLFNQVRELFLRLVAARLTISVARSE